MKKGVLGEKRSHVYELKRRRTAAVAEVQAAAAALQEEASIVLDVAKSLGRKY